MTRQAYIEYKQGFDTKAGQLKQELADFFGAEFPEIAQLSNLRIIWRYTITSLNEEQFKDAIESILWKPGINEIYYGHDFPVKKSGTYFGVEYIQGQFDERSDSMEQCIEILTGIKPRVKVSDFYVLECEGGKSISTPALNAVKKYLINPIDLVEAKITNTPDNEFPEQQNFDSAAIPDVEILNGFITDKNPESYLNKYGLAMSKDDLLFLRDWFVKEGRDPTITELRMLDTYWSDHCRHSTFNTTLEEIKVQGEGVSSALELYEKTRNEVYGDKPRPKSLMDMATIAARLMKKQGMLSDLDESKEVNACTVKIRAEYDDGSSEPWLLLFKNETHNHPTEMEPFGGAATCLGGAIRDPLSGRAHVYQAMRITGGGDPRGKSKDTLPGKLPQIKIAREAALGYSSYGNQVGVAAAHLAEFYHPGFLAKRMEMGAVIGAVSESWVRREEPEPGDVVILVGGKTGRDGVGGATGSSQAPSGSSSGLNPAGNAREERKILRLFRKAEVSRLIKRCNDFGAGGVSVAVGELADGLEINLDAVPPKYPGLDGTELAISESQERMAVVCSASDADKFIKEAAKENLDAVIIAKVTEDPRLKMYWRGKLIVDLSREFLDSNGAPRYAAASFTVKELPKITHNTNSGGGENPGFGGVDPDALPMVLLDKLERELAGLRSGSRRGLGERFDSSTGSDPVLFPWGGAEQGTPECGMAALLPVLPSSGKNSLTASIMTFGYDPVLLSRDPYSGAKGSVLEALAKYACLGGDPFKARLSFQEYFEKTVDPESWGLPAAALLGALEAQLCLGVPAIGGKDSMSGNYSDPANGIDIKVPPSLAAFAAGIVHRDKIRSGALSGKAGNLILLFSQAQYADEQTEKTLDEWEIFKGNIKALNALSESGAVKAAYPVVTGGIAVSLALMAFGNMTGVEAYTDSFIYADEYNYQGSFLAEIDEDLIPSGMLSELNSCKIAGRTLSEPVFRITKPVASVKMTEVENPEALVAETPLAVLRRAYEYPLAEVYPQTSTGSTITEIEDSPPSSQLLLPAFTLPPTSSLLPPPSSQPLVVLPVFPGTNSEWDMERAFIDAKGKTRLVVFKNRTKEDIEASLKEFEGAIKEAQIIAFSGGFSPGNGSFIEEIIRKPVITAALEEFLNKKSGLILGICEGFQALLRTGLLPYGKIMPKREYASGSKTNDHPANFTHNLIGRHVSRMIYTRVMPNNSPWLSLDKEGDIHTIYVSHGEGRIIVSENEAQTLFSRGQVPFCYADNEGKPSMAEPYNPGGSLYAIESLTSPDGRILGKMGHSERYGKFMHVNIPGNKKQGIFEAGVKYFL